LPGEPPCQYTVVMTCRSRRGPGDSPAARRSAGKFPIKNFSSRALGSIPRGYLARRNPAITENPRLSAGAFVCRRYV
jgi:hypothetical protein